MQVTHAGHTGRREELEGGGDDIYIHACTHTFTYSYTRSCIHSHIHILTHTHIAHAGEKSLKEAALKSMKEQNEKVLSTIKEIQGKIEAATKDEKPPPAATA